MSFILQENGSPFWDKSIDWLLFTVLALALAYVLDRYFRVRPKIYASINWGGLKGKSESSGGTTYNEMIMIWRRQFVLLNDTNYEARDLQLIWPYDKPALSISIPPRTIVRPNEQIQIEFVATKSFPRSTVEASSDRRTDLLPQELRKTQFAISYLSNTGKRFYTRFTFEDGKDPLNTFHRFKPRLTNFDNT